MRFTETPLKGAFVVESTESIDERGSFFRTFCADEFRDHGLPSAFLQCGISRNSRRGTLRGMHFQRAPKAEGKLVRCISGKVYDVMIDLRRESSTFRRWFAIELDSGGSQAVYIPEGMAHGFLTLTDNAEIFYQMTESYVSELADGVRWNDPSFGITWPADVLVISERDRTLPDFR
ncbi:MAG: dTDP-4-dehydrorhamnose 3,5-epimerase [Afipia sp.]|nr:dTDP-4-dehydrorhamnose 3,5-epimerase [Afipia sp.]